MDRENLVMGIIMIILLAIIIFCILFPMYKYGKHPFLFWPDLIWEILKGIFN